MVEHAVVVAGAGPTGLMLAGELALAGVDVVVVERRPDQSVDGSRAGGLHARTIEVLEQRGIADRFLTAGTTAQVQGFALNMLDISDFPSRHPYGLALFQSRFEPILAGWVEELGVPILREREVVGVTADDHGVDVEVSDGTTLRAGYLVGCDGGRSVVRRLVGIDFVGTDPTTSWIVAEAEMPDAPERAVHRDARGMHALNRLGPEGPVRLVVTEPDLRDGDEPSVEELREALVAVFGTDHGLRGASWISRFTDVTRQASEYRRGRVLLAGDAAHVHPPHGGQGLNIGVQDAVNLGWKLAQVVHGTAPASLLDTYHAERHPVGARVLRLALAQVALNRGGDAHDALRETVTELVGLDEARRYLAAIISGLDLRYDLGDGHPLVGRRMPDLDLRTDTGLTRVSTLLHAARHVLLLLDDAVAERDAWRPRVEVVLATVEGADPGGWELPVIGIVPAPVAVLIRPDGYVAWAGDPDDEALVAALTRWVGPPTT